LPRLDISALRGPCPPSCGLGHIARAVWRLPVASVERCPGYLSLQFSRPPPSTARPPLRYAGSVNQRLGCCNRLVAVKACGLCGSRKTGVKFLYGLAKTGTAHPQ